MSKEIPLSKGRVALVDDEDFQVVNAFRWCFSPGGAIRSMTKAEGGKGTVFMHRVLCAVSSKMRVLHIDGNKLNNQRDNLRIVSISEMRRRPHAKNKTGYKGVHHMHSRFMAKIALDGRSIYLGTFGTAADAARAYDRKLLEYYNGELPEALLSECNFKEPIYVPATDSKPEFEDIKSPDSRYGSEGLGQDDF